MKNNTSFGAAGFFGDREIVETARLEAVRHAAETARGDAMAELFAGVGRLLRRLVELPRRVAVRNELSLLSDRELADIGLSRSDLSHVFDEAFAAAREADRSGARTPHNAVA